MNHDTDRLKTLLDAPSTYCCLKPAVYEAGSGPEIGLQIMIFNHVKTFGEAVQIPNFKPQQHLNNQVQGRVKSSIYQCQRNTWL